MALHFPLAEWEALYVIASPTFSPWNTRSPLQVYICTEGNPSITIDLSHDDRADGGREERQGAVAWLSVYVREGGGDSEKQEREIKHVGGCAWIYSCSSCHHSRTRWAPKEMPPHAYLTLLE